MPDGIFEDSRIKTTYAIDVNFDGVPLGRMDMIGELIIYFFF